MEFTYYGHACFSVRIENVKLLFDPFITHNPMEAAKSIRVEEIEADYILISHGHGDHFADCIDMASRTGALVIANGEISDKLTTNGIPAHGMNIGGQANFLKGQFTYEKGDVRVKCVTAHHSSDMPDGSYGGCPMGFIVYVGGQAFYYAGDTGLTMDMQLIPRWAALNFAVLPLGDNYTMGPEDAVECARMIDCKTIIGVHYDTFEVIRLDRTWAQEIFSQAGLGLMLPNIGETIQLN